MICVPVSASTPEGMLEGIRQNRPGADMMEIRLDALAEPEKADVERFLNEASIPVICTCRHGSEGGKWQGEESKRLEILIKAVEAGAAYVDLELSSGKAAIKELRACTSGKGCRLILSFHDFSGTPDRGFLLDIMNRQQENGADTGKIVVMAKEIHDISVPFSLYHVAEEKAFSLLAFSMGEAGRISRLACLAMGAPFTFAAPDQGEGSAPGQITSSEMKALMTRLLQP